MFRNHQQIHRVILHFLSTSQTEVCCWFVCLWKFLQHIKLVQYQHRATATVQHRIYCWCFCLNSWLMGNRVTTSPLSLLLLCVIHRCINPCLPAKHQTSFHILSPPHPESGIMSHFQSKSVLISWSWCDDIFFFLHLLSCIERSWNIVLRFILELILHHDRCVGGVACVRLDK